MHYHLWPSFPLTCIFWGYIHVYPAFLNKSKVSFFRNELMYWLKLLCKQPVRPSRWCIKTHQGFSSWNRGDVPGWMLRWKRRSSWWILANLGLIQVLRKNWAQFHSATGASNPALWACGHLALSLIPRDALNDSGLLEMYWNASPMEHLGVKSCSLFHFWTARENTSHLNRHDAVSFQISGGAVHG